MSAVLVRLCLALSLWHAPLPILHAHTLSLPDVDGNEELVDHLVKFHHDDCLPVPDRSHPHSDWHWHLIIPACQGCCSSGEPGSNPEDCCNLVWKYATAPTADSTIHSLSQFNLNPIAIDGLSQDGIFIVAAPSLDVERGHSGYVQSLAFQGKISLQELLSRRLC